MTSYQRYAELCDGEPTILEWARWFRERCDEWRELTGGDMATPGGRQNFDVWFATWLAECERERDERSSTGDSAEEKDRCCFPPG